MAELCCRNLITLVYWEWQLIWRWPFLRNIFARLPEQLLKGFVSWGSPGKHSIIDYFLGDVPVRYFVLLVLEYCSAMWCSAADTHLKLTDAVLSDARFLTGGMLEFAHRQYVAVLCMMYKIRCNPAHHLYCVYLGRMCKCVSHPVLWSHIGTLMSLLAAEPSSAAGLKQLITTYDSIWVITTYGSIQLIIANFDRVYLSVILIGYNSKTSSNFDKHLGETILYITNLPLNKHFFVGIIIFLSIFMFHVLLIPSLCARSVFIV